MILIRCKGEFFMSKNYDDELKLLGISIRLWREKKRLSQEELSFNANIHRTYLSQLELGKRNPSYTTLLKLAKALSISIFDLLPNKDEL